MLSRTRLAVLSLLAVVVALGSTAQAQEVTLDIRVADPLPRDLQAWEDDPTLLRATVRNTTGEDFDDLRFAFTLTGDRRGLVAQTIDGHPAQPRISLGARETRVLTWPEFGGAEESIDIESSLIDEVARDGIPEDFYELCVTIFDFGNGPPREVGGTGDLCVVFTVEEPDPPELVVPLNGEAVQPPTPIFTWAFLPRPGAAGLSYRLTIKPLFEGQTSTDAIVANPVLFDEEIPTTTYIYRPSDAPFDLFPLAESFVWQVQALQFGEPYGRNRGLSPVGTFRVDERETGEGAPGLPPTAPPGTLADLGDVILEEALALLPDLPAAIERGTVTVEETAGSYILSGTTRMRLDLDDTMRLDATLDGLTLAKDDLERAAGGRLRVERTPESLPLSDAEPLTIRAVTWAFGTGVAVEAELRVPDVTDETLTGVLAVTNGGLAGVLEGGGTPENPLFTFGDDPLRVLVTSFRATFPGAEITAAGVVEALGSLRCDITDLKLSADGLDTESKTALACRSDDEFPLVGESDRVTLRLDRLTGTLGPLQEPLTYDLTLQARLGLAADNPATGEEVRCGLAIAGGLQTGGAFAIEQVVPDCPIPDPSLDLGFVALDFSDLRADRLAYTPGAGWDFALGFDAALRFPGFDDLTVASANGFTISDAGLTVPRVALDRAALERAAFTADGFGMTLRRLTINAFTFPLFSWERIGPGPWDLAFDADVTLPETEAMPACLANAVIGFSGFRSQINGEDIIGGELRLDDLAPCRWDLGDAGFALDLRRLDGQLNWQRVSADADLDARGRFALDAALVAAAPFGCAGSTAGALGEGELTVRNSLYGRVALTRPSCPVGIGPFEASIREATLTFGETSRLGSEAVLDATARLAMADGGIVDGSFVLDLVTGDFLDVRFVLDQPFALQLPSTADPAMTFRINRAELSMDGLLIDGRHQLQTGTTTIGTTFDQALFALSLDGLTAGRVVFDAPFAFAAGIDPATGNLDGQAVALGAPLGFTPGVRFDLDGQVVLDSAGVRASGTAAAALALDGSLGDNAERYDSDFSVEMSEDFVVGLSPAFGVRDGQADLLWQGRRVAYMDPAGFHLDPAFIANALLPDTLALPSQDVAYVVLKRDDRWLVDLEPVANDAVRIRTRPSEPLELVVPALAEGGQPAPRLAVAFNDAVFTTDPSSPELVSGTIAASVPQGLALGPDVPFTVRALQYGVGTIDGRPQSALFLQGDVQLFDQTVGANNDVTLAITTDGVARGTFDVGGLSELVPVVSGSDRVDLLVEAVRGTMTVPVTASAPGSATFAFDADARLQVNGDAGPVAEATMTVEAGPGHIAVTDFAPAFFGERPTLGFDDFGIRMDSLTTLAEFRYDTQTGFDFAVKVDLAVVVEVEGAEQFVFPLRGVEIRDEGLVVPPQDVSRSSLPGLQLPPFALGGVELEPLALRTAANLVFDWYSGTAFGLDPRFDFALRLPGFADTGLVPVDGFTVTDAGYSDGILTGTVTAHTPQDGARLPLAPGGPTLVVTRAVGTLEERGGMQAVDLDLDATLEDLPNFANGANDGGGGAASCPQPTTFQVTLVDGLGFAGSVENFAPCGTLALGPAALRVTGSALAFGYTNDVQLVRLDGGVVVDLPGPSAAAPPTQITGSLVLDVLTGTIADGSILVTQPFGLGLPFEDPMLTFTVNEAELSAAGLRLRAQGTVNADPATVGVTFNDLLVDLQAAQVVSGDAVIAAGVGVEVPLSPIDLRLVAASAPPFTDEGLRFDFNSAVTLDAQGLRFAGSGTGAFNFAGEVRSNLRLEFENGFAVNVGAFAVRQGRAALYLDEGGRATEPLAYLDATGFHVGGGVVALLPDRLPLPTEDVAYIQLKDAQGQPLVDVAQQSDGGYTLATRPNEPLPIVLAALDNTGAPPTVLAAFSLTTDAAYNPTGGALTLQAEGDLEPALDLPVRLTALALTSTGSGVTLEAGLRIDLPDGLDGVNADALDATLALGPDGFQGTAEIGTYATAYDPSLAPVVTFETTGTLSGSPQPDAFTVDVTGVRLSFGNTNGIDLAGTVASSLLTDDSGVPARLFYTAGYVSNQWAFSVDPVTLPTTIPLGLADLKPADVDPVELDVTDTSVVVSFSGEVAFDDVLGEPLAVSVEDLRVGVENVPSQPALVFGLGGAGVTVPDQQADLFDGAVTLTLLQPGLAVSGRVLTVSARSGRLTLMEQAIDFQDISVATDGQFNLGQATVRDVDLVEDYVALQTLTLSASNARMRLAATLEATLPAPVDSEAEGTLTIDRNAADGTVNVAAAVAFQTDLRYDLGDNGFATFELTKAGVELDVVTPENSGVYANGRVLIPRRQGDRASGEAEILFGEATGFPANAGLGYSPGQGLRYNATGHAAFAVEFGFFDLSVTADASVSDQSQFQVVLGGTAGFTVPNVAASLGYEGLTITPDGVTDWGNLDGTGSVSVMDIVSLGLGKFVYEEAAEGESFTIQIAESTGDTPADPSAAPPTREVSGVRRYLCFGPCSDAVQGGTPPAPSRGDALTISLGGSGNADGGGGFSGGVGRVLFYETADATKLFAVDDANLAIGQLFEMNASLLYESGPDGVLLRASGTGAFEAGGQAVGAAIAGSFSNKNDELSFGLFVAVAADAGVPIVPGVVTATGLGGGFFYKPAPEDLRMVTDAIQGAPFNYTPVREGGIPTSLNADFAAMLYAKAGIGNAVAPYIIDAQAYFQVTNESVYLDAQGTVLELDGEGSPAGAELRAGLYIGAQYEPFFLEGGVALDLAVPVVLTGDMDLNLFMGMPEGQSNLIWGIIGEADFEVYSILDADGTFLASSDGFLIEAGMGIEADIASIISINAQARASIWLIDAPGFSMPFGAYATFSAEACLGFCISGEAKGAFVTRRGGGYQLYAGVKGCVDLFFSEPCLRAWMSLDGGGWDGGVGEGAHGDLVAQAQAQRDQFRQRIEDLKNQMTAAKEALQAPPAYQPVAVSTQDLERAGTNLYLAGDSERRAWFDLMAANEQAPLPSGLNSTRTVLGYAASPFTTIPANADLAPETALVRANSAVARAERSAEAVLPHLSNVQQRAITELGDASQAFDDMLAALVTSPVQSRFVPDTSGVITASTSFSIDGSLASQQAGFAAQTRAEIEALDAAFRESIEDVAQSVREIDRLMGSNPSVPEALAPTDNMLAAFFQALAGAAVNSAAEDFAGAIEATDRYYAKLANLQWEQRAFLLSRHSQLDLRGTLDALPILSSRDVPGGEGDFTLTPEASSRAAARLGIVYALRDGQDASTFNPRASFSWDPTLSSFHRELTRTQASNQRVAIKNDIEGKAGNLWYDIHDLGLPAAALHLTRTLDPIREQHRLALNGVRASYADMTESLDLAYDVKADLVTTLHGLVDNYAVWREAAYGVGDSVSVAYAGYRGALEDALAPPTVAALTVTPNRISFFNEAGIRWATTHPLGLAESAIQVQIERRDGPQSGRSDSDVGTGFYNYETVGNADAATVVRYRRVGDIRDAFAADAPYEEEDYSVGVRVRGPAGRMTVRRGSFQLQLGPNGAPSTPAGTPVQTQDASPPTALLYLESFYEKGTQILNGSIGTFSFPVPVERWWTNDGQRLRLHVVAEDRESDIATFEYAIGSGEGGQDVVPWSRLEGDLDYWPLPGESRMQKVLDARTRILNMEPGRAYYVSVRVTNGVGITSRTISDPHGIVFDPSPPTAPSQLSMVALDDLPFSPPVWGGIPLYTDAVNPLVTSTPADESTPSWSEYNTMVRSDLVPVASLSWQASEDEESGVMHYLYCLTEDAAVPEGCDVINRTTTTETSVSFVGGPNRHYNLLRDFGDEF
ncbi:MAG: hypothetical protein AAFY55_10605, partial [Bacteroidota bacterium]